MSDVLLKLSDKLIFERNRCLGLFNEKVLFIHIPKAAGTTVRRSTVLAGKIKSVNKRMLKSREYTSQLYKTMRKIGDHHGVEHARFVDLNLEAQLMKRKFAVIRNPWDRVVSRYFFAKQVIEIEKKYGPNKHKISSFEEFLEERFEWGNQPFMWHRAIRGWFPCADYVTDAKGSIKVDILRLENLNVELCNYFDIKVMDRRRNVTSARAGIDKREIYNDRTIQIVADWFAKDVEYFGYDFDTSARKNTYFE